MSENVANLFCYLGVWVTGLVFFLLEKKRPVVRFHAAQSLIWFGGLHVLSIVFSVSLFIFLVDIIYLVWVISWVFLMYKGYQGGIYKLPYIGDIAEKISKT